MELVIGVAVQEGEQEAAREFFELFKTPWEFCQDRKNYEVLICTGVESRIGSADLVLCFSGSATRFDAGHEVRLGQCGENAAVLHQQSRIPIYGNLATFPASAFSAVADGATRRPAACLIGSDGKQILRIGYDLFQEVRFLLTKGQPAVNAAIPALELHIALMRDLITGFGVPVVEIPPVPDGHKLIACLTHDVDHPKLRNHWLDHTMFGFVFRATIGSLYDFCRGRKSLNDLIINWLAALRLPFVYLGMAKDVWDTFDRYRELEGGLGAAYFIIPRKGYPGRRPEGDAPAKRGSGYEPEDIGPQIQAAVKAGCEIGLHGIDAWLDAASGLSEKELVAKVAGTSEGGVRMHWLFFDENSTAVLDQAGFSYDSTFGYNETVGYRAGTAQAYKPLNAATLLELPLHVMDTALFFPGYLNLREADAKRAVSGIIEEVCRFGGALTINWHDRSIAPERLWDGFYRQLIGQLKEAGAWMPNASQAVAWFRKRRSVSLEAGREQGGALRISASVNASPQLPGLRVRVHKPTRRYLNGTNLAPTASGFVDLSLEQTLETSVVC